MKHRHFLIAMFIFGSIACVVLTMSAQVSWIQTNGPCGGSINRIIATPQGGLFALSQLGRMFRSTDQGITWVQTWTDIGGQFLWSVASDSVGNVFVGTGAGEVYKSTDGGERWTALAKVPAQKEILTVAVNKEGHIFAGTGGTTIFHAQGPFRSFDGGASWESLQIDSQPVSLLDMVFTSSGRIYALTGGGLYRSTDNGANWVNLWPQNGNSVAINSQGYLFVGTSFGGYPGMYRSTDDGQTWAKVNTGLTAPSVREVVIGTSNIIFAAADGGVFSSVDDGVSWKSVTSALSSEDFRCITLDRHGDIIAGTSLGSQLGILRSTDGGQSWYAASAGLMNIQITSLASDSRGTIYAAGTYGGLWKSSDRGNSWVSLGRLSSLLNVVACNQNGAVFVGGIGGEVFYSTDYGTSWAIDTIPNGLSVRQFAFDTEGIIYAVTVRALYKSSDVGKTWQRSDASSGDFNVRSLLILPTGAILAGTSEGLFRSYDSKNFTRIALESESIGSLGISVDGILFATTGYGGVYRSADQGVSWTQVNSGLPRPLPFESNIPIGHVTINAKGHIYVTVGDSGIYFSKNNGDSWSPEIDGLTDLEVTSMVFDPSSYLFAGTKNSSVFRTTQTTVTSVGSSNVRATAFTLEQNFPNPFNPGTTIRYQVTASSFVTLKVFDVLGREIAALVNAEQSPGRYQLTFDAGNLTGGVYFYRIQAGPFFDTKKFILMK